MVKLSYLEKQKLRSPKPILELGLPSFRLGLVCVSQNTTNVARPVLEGVPETKFSWPTFLRVALWMMQPAGASGAKT